jgi:hypothetical protein
MTRANNLRSIGRISWRMASFKSFNVRTYGVSECKHSISNTPKGKNHTLKDRESEGSTTRLRNGKWGARETYFEQWSLTCLQCALWHHLVETTHWHSLFFFGAVLAAEDLLSFRCSEQSWRLQWLRFLQRSKVQWCQKEQQHTILLHYRCVVVDDGINVLISCLLYHYLVVVVVVVVVVMQFRCSLEVNFKISTRAKKRVQLIIIIIIIIIIIMKVTQVPCLAFFNHS